MRKLQPMPEGQGEQQARPTLRTDKPTAAYARRSPSYAKAEKKDKTQSREMQTEDIKIWALEQGWKEKHFHPYFSDFGLSGALRPDQRPDMLRLFDNIDEGKFDRGSVICYQESRLFRDETQIYYNQFIEKCKQHEMYYVRGVGYKRVWTEEEDAIVQEHYATLPRKELMALLPDRGWLAIVGHCRLLELSRQDMAEDKIVGAKRFSYTDLEFMRSKGWHYNTRCTTWGRLYLLLSRKVWLLLLGLSLWEQSRPENCLWWGVSPISTYSGCTSWTRAISSSWA